MALLLELDCGCIARKRVFGAEPAEAERACQDTPAFQQGAFARSFAHEGPQKPPGEAKDDPEGETTPRKRRAHHKVTESPYGQFPGQFPTRTLGLTRWGGRDLVPGFVPLPRDPRTEAHLWAQEMTMVGQRPPFNREAWGVHAQRMGFAPEQIVAGWDYIENVFSRKALGEFAGAQAGQWRGYYTQTPHELKVRMQGDRGPASWPWVTKAAEAVYLAAEKFIKGHPDTNIDTAFEQGLEGAGVSVFDLTPEDDALMGIALQWRLQGKNPDPEPPSIPNQRGVTGFKGTQVSHGRELAPRGAP